MKIVVLTVSVGLLWACSTTRVLPEGKYRLASNKIVFNGDPAGLSSGDVSSYVKQQTSNATITTWIYNWSNPVKDDWLNNSLRKVGTAPVVFNGDLLGSSCENIARHLDYLGYYNSEVTAKVDTIKKNVKVTYTVTPGNRCRIDSVIFKVPEGEFAEDFAEDVKNIMVTESERGAAFFRNKGYYDLSKFNYFFEADTLGPRNTLTYEIREYSRKEAETNALPLAKYHIGKVQISHTSTVPFREKILRDVNIIKPGDLYSEKVANINYQRFSSLRLFNNVAVEMSPADSAIVDCNVTVSPSKTKGVKINLEASTNANGFFGISPALSFYNKNIFHGGEWFSIGFSGNFQRQFSTDIMANEFGVNVSLSLPRFLGLPYSVFKGPNIPRTEFKGSYNYQDRPEFKRFIANASFGYTGNNNNIFYQLYPFRTTIVKASYINPDFFTTLFSNYALLESFYDHIDAGLGGQMYWTTDTSVIPKGGYTTIRFAFDVAGNIISLFNPILPEDEYGEKLLFGMHYAQYARGELNLSHCFMFSPNTKLAVNFTGGIGHGYGVSQYMPYEKQFYVGGASSMRGWQARALGPGADKPFGIFQIASQAGETKLEFDLELRQKLFWKFEGALFAEAGNVWDFQNPDEDVSDYPFPVDRVPWIETFGLDWGVGLRLNLNFILLRLDWGLKIFEPSLDGNDRWIRPVEWFKSGGSSIHFGVGYPF